jgi:DNA-binding NtrC family response regulator
MKTVLIIDDELFMRTHLPRLVQRFGANAVTAEGATEGIRLFREKKPDLVFLDITLADGHGLQVFHKLKEIDAKAKVCFISGSDTVMQKMQSLNLGAIGFLNKPFFAEDIKRIIDLV